MELFIISALLVLVIFAITDLTVGVANDAVNFLNSAWGSKAGSVKLLMILVSVGVLVGAMFSGGMMEVARKGIFDPNSFYLVDIICIFVAVIIADVILLDFFNSYGLPTSTTVSLVFGLLGSAFVISAIKIGQAGDSLSTLGNYLNTDKAMVIILGIFISIAIAFFVGAIIQYVTRILFSFSFKRYELVGGSIFGGIAISIISYFIFYKGIASVSFINDNIVNFINDNIWIIILSMMVLLTILFFVVKLIFKKFNIFRFIVLYGTFALAMSFAGNDLVNFIGVPLAGIDSYKLFKESGATDPATFSMGALAAKTHAPFAILLFAGLVMIITIWFNKKMRTVLNTAVDLSRQSEGKERFESSAISRGILRFALKLNNFFSVLKIGKMHRWIESRFNNEDNDSIKKDAPAFDLVRAAVNLTVSSSLIAFATSLKLPLSTTYVTFMVAMGTSLSDRAWGRESAVFRISGVLTVIGGWFLTAFIAFFFAGLLAAIIFYTKWVGLLICFFLAVFIFIRSHILHNKKLKIDEENKKMLEDDKINIVEKSRNEVKDVIAVFPKIFNQIISGLEEEDLKKLKKTVKKSKEIYELTEGYKESINSTISSLTEDQFSIGRYYMENVELLRELSISLEYLTKPTYQHLNNQHKNLSSQQIEDLKNVFDLCKDYIANANECLFSTKVKTQSFIENKQCLNRLVYDLKTKQMRLLKSKKITARANLLFINIIDEVRHFSGHIDDIIDNEIFINNQYPNM